MDGNVFGYEIVPDQMQVINPAIVLVLIPFFDRIFYPIMTKYKMLDNALHRMAIGGIAAGLAFLSAGIVELLLERTYPELPEEHHTSLNFINTLPCNVKVHNPFNGIQNISSSELFRFKNLLTANNTKYNISARAAQQCGDVIFCSNYIRTDITALENQVNAKYFSRIISLVMI